MIDEIKDEPVKKWIIIPAKDLNKWKGKFYGELNNQRYNLARTEIVLHLIVPNEKGITYGECKKIMATPEWSSPEF